MSELSKKEKLELLKKQLSELENEPEKDPEEASVLPLVKADEGVYEEDDDNSVQKKSRKPMKKYERTEAQKQAMKKAFETKMKNAEQRRILKEQEAEEQQKILQEKLVQKAIELKKKQIKKEKVIDEIVKEPVLSKEKPIAKAPQLPPKPKYIFV